MQNRPFPRGTARVTPNGYVGYQGYQGGTNPKPVQSVAEILSQPLGDVPPDLAGAQSGLNSKREIAELLTGRAMGRNATGLVDGFAQLGEAFLANKAIRKADTAEKDYSAMVQALTQKAVGGDEASIAALLSPEAAIERKDEKTRQGVEDARYVDERDYGRGRDALGDKRYDTEWQYGVGRDLVGDQQWKAEFDAQEKQRRAAAAAASATNGKYGLNVIYGRDKDGNRVALQANSAGGVDQASLPEGVTLEDDYSKAYDRTLGSEVAKKDMYKTTAGMAVLAVEEGFNRVTQQIDQAIQLSDGNNTGLIGSKLPAPNLDAMLETIGANTAFESLVALKSQGGSLGALSDAELGLLMSKVANLKRSQTQDQLDANLEILRIAMQNSMMRIKQAYEQEYANGAYGRPAAGPAVQPGARVGPSGQPVPEGFE